MATIVLGAAGSMIGGSFGGSALGLGGAAFGRAAGSLIGRSIDQKILGAGSEAVEHGRIDRLHLTGASEGATLPKVVGAMRIGGHVIWATRFKEHRSTQAQGGGGKGRTSASATTTVNHTYSVSFALALCQGPIRCIRRVWADGREVAKSSLNMRIHLGAEDQLPDALIEAVDGAAPAFRGTAYVVFEDLNITPFGNRIPQFSFEVVCAARAEGEVPPAADLVQGVALVPGSGEYALATTAVYYDYDDTRETANVNNVEGEADFRVALDQVRGELPNLKSTSLVASWFGDDLRCGLCRIRPKVEQTEFDGERQAWHVSGLMRKNAQKVPELEGRPVYGGTPSDTSVIEAIQTMNDTGLDVTFYPFILMDQMKGNGLPDPWGGAEQAVLPWRGRITSSSAPGWGDVQGSAQAEAEVTAFFGTARAEDFSARNLGGETGWIIDGPSEWSYRRFILHYAKLCAVAGGVEAFCIGSEMRGLTQVMGPQNRFPAVKALRDLAVEVRKLLPKAKIGYAADWSEYFGYHPQSSKNVFFHLDPLWSDPAIDFIGIDNYMPLSDWRDGASHADATWGSVTNINYLRANVEGGEGYDWFYASAADRESQNRTAISDGLFDEDWVFRFKDVRNWWANQHHDRVNGAREIQPTNWVPESKPIRFIEYGCAAINKGANQPNKFLDPKSSESQLPRYSNGERDDEMQMQYLRAFASYWDAADRNPVSSLYNDQMIDMAHSFVWAWDTRPSPSFPELTQVWSDATNWQRGHWLSGRAALMPLATVIREICCDAGLFDIDVSKVRGIVRGFRMDGVQTARERLQPLLIAYGVEVADIGGQLVFSSRGESPTRTLPSNRLVRSKNGTEEHVRGPKAELTGRVIVQHVAAEGDYQHRISDAVHPGNEAVPVRSTELPLVLTAGEANNLAERFLTEARTSGDGLTLFLPLSRRDILAGNLVQIEGDSALWRVDRLEDNAGGRKVEAVRAEPRALQKPVDPEGPRTQLERPLAPIPVKPLILNLPILIGTEDPAAPYLAVEARPWQGPIAVYSAVEDKNYQLEQIVEAGATVGRTLSEMPAAPASVYDRGAEVLVRMPAASVQAFSDGEVLAGANAMAIGTGDSDGWEIFQFRDVRLVEPGIWALSNRLRGQRGTEGAIRSPWPIGSMVVALDSSLQQLRVAPDHVGLERHYRFGPASRPLDHSSYIHQRASLPGAGFKPYAPVHLRLYAKGGARLLRWFRRSRLPTEGWGSVDVPLAEDQELYEVLFCDASGNPIDRRLANQPELQVELSDWSRLVEGGMVELRVAQVSSLVGSGHVARLIL